MDDTTASRTIPAIVIWPDGGLYTMRFVVTGDPSNTYEMVETMISPQYRQSNLLNFRAYILSLQWSIGMMIASCIVQDVYNFSGD